MNISATLLAYLQTHPNQDLTLEQIRHGVSPAIELTPKQVRANMGLLVKKMEPQIKVVIRGNVWKFQPVNQAAVTDAAARKVVDTEPKLDQISFKVVGKDENIFILKDPNGSFWKAEKLS